MHRIILEIPKFCEFWFRQGAGEPCPYGFGYNPE
jgi:hypothetical protein